ncbi:MAG TPA: hypothetical protein VHY08_17440 [Bacillota bacterium]|nr:hypothetical protein [Bacillota bacterium]
MVDDRQIRDPLAQTKQFFLSDDLLAGEPKINQYSLAGEFSRTRRNRLALVYGLVLVYILTLGIGAFLLINNENIKNNKLNVNISDFKQSNLTELLDTKKQDDQKISDLQKELDNLKQELQKETAKINQNSLTDSQILRLKSLSAEEQKKAIAELTKTQAAKVAQLTDEYNSKIKLKEQELANYQKKADVENKKLNQTVKLNQEQLSQYQDAAALSLQKQKQDYEIQLAKLRADHQAEIETLKSENDRNVETLMSQISQLQKAGSDNAGIISNLRAYLSSYRYALTSLAAETHENGFVIDARDRNRIIVFIYNLYTVKKGDIAHIYRDEPNTPMAKIQLTPEGDMVTAKIIDNPGVKIKPFDRILLDRRGNK